MALSCGSRVLLAVVYLALCGALALVVCAQFLVIMKYGFNQGVKKVYIWRTCELDSAGQEICFRVTSNKQCSELSSRLKTVGAFSALTAMSIVILMVAIVAEVRGVKFPVQHLIKAIFGWCLFPLIVACSFTIGTLIARLCSDPLPLTDRNGSYEDAFFCLCAAVVLVLIAGGAYAFCNVGAEDTEEARLKEETKARLDDDEDLKPVKDSARLL
jgi:hypothetical protein